MRPTIVPATLRDMSYVLSNLGPADEEELACQIDPDIKRHHLAYGLLMSGDNFAARVGDQPVAVFGTAPINRATLSVWALGTKRMPEVADRLARFICHDHIPTQVEQGYRYMEARSHVNHTTAHRWMAFWGAVPHGPPFEYGTAGEKFILFRWSATDLASIRQRRRRLRTDRN